MYSLAVDQIAELISLLALSFSFSKKGAALTPSGAILYRSAASIRQKKAYNAWIGSNIVNNLEITVTSTAGLAYSTRIATARITSRECRLPGELDTTRTQCIRRSAQ